jgi:hypothetical protein
VSLSTMHIRAIPKLPPIKLREKNANISRREHWSRTDWNDQSSEAIHDKINIYILIFICITCEWMLSSKWLLIAFCFFPFALGRLFGPKANPLIHPNFFLIELMDL